MRKRSLQLLAAGAVLAPTLAFTFGGWAVITVDDLPEYAVAGQPFVISYVVRQHGMSVLRDFNADVSASPTAPKTSPSLAAAAGRAEAGPIVSIAHANGDRYLATVTLPKPGNWTLTLNHAFAGTSNALAPLLVIANTAAPPPGQSDRDRGLHLFVAKGCVSCHMRDETAAWRSFDVAPRLNGRQYRPDLLAAFLADPEKSPLSQATKTGYVRMPNLGLRPKEITALVAFVNSESRVASGRGSPETKP